MTATSFYQYCVHLQTYTHDRKQSPDKRMLCFTNNIVTERKLGGILLGCYPDCKILAAHCRTPWPTQVLARSGRHSRRTSAHNCICSTHRRQSWSKSLSSADELKNEYVCSIQTTRRPASSRRISFFFIHPNPWYLFLTFFFRISTAGSDACIANLQSLCSPVILPVAQRPTTDEPLKIC